MIYPITLLNGDGETSVAVAQEMSGYPPTYFRWEHSPAPNPIRTVYRDAHIHLAEFDSVENRIGLLIEAREFRPWNYDAAYRLRKRFKAIFTYDETMLTLGPPFQFYPLGGNYIRDWEIFPKTRIVSIIVGQKKGLPGWDLRHAVMENFGDEVDVYGWPDLINPKTPALRPYYFSIIIEAVQQDFYFGEKLIDCISQGTIPIYWGCPSIDRFFLPGGIIPFSTLDDLGRILADLTTERYADCEEYARLNLETARQYRLPEDWLYLHHPDLFGRL